MCNSPRPPPSSFLKFGRIQPVATRLNRKNNNSTLLCIVDQVICFLV
jgi:hypothetical protein